MESQPVGQAAHTGKSARFAQSCTGPQTQFDSARMEDKARAALGRTFDPAESAAKFAELLKLPPDQRKAAFEKWIDKRMFELAPDEHPVYERYALKLLGRGGSQIVYSNDKHPNTAIKANFGDIRRLIFHNAQFAGRRLNHVPKDLHADRQSVVRALNGQKIETRRFFGRHVLRSRMYSATIPVPTRIVGQVRDEMSDLPSRFAPSGVFASPLHELGDAPTIDFPALILLQEKTDFYDRPDALSVQGFYAENASVNPDLDEDTYSRANLRWLECGFQAERRFDRDLLLATQRTPDKDVLAELLRTADRDPEFHAQLREFVALAADYTNKTGRALDILGSDNVLFARNDEGNWDYLLVDAEYPSPAPTVTAAASSLRIFCELPPDKKTPPDRTAGGEVWNGLNYARTINGLLDYFGLPHKAITAFAAVSSTTRVPWPQILPLLRNGLAFSHSRSPDLVKAYLEPSYLTPNLALARNLRRHRLAA